MSGATLSTPHVDPPVPTHSTVQLVAPRVERTLDRPPSRHEAAIGDVIGDRYELRDRVAAGGLGVVFRAIHRETGRVVAVKLLHDRYRDEASLIERTAREARFACSVHHPSIVEVLDAGRSADGQAYITMEFLDGRTLRAFLKEAGCVDPIEAAKIMLPIVEAVAAAHAVGVVHRDLKPENVIVVDSAGVRSIKVLDFGIAGAVSEPGVDHRLTTIGTVLGTHAYMSPEQATGGVPEPAFDVFALGVMLYELLTGVLPFGSNPSRSLTAKIRGFVDMDAYERADVPEPWRALVARCVAVDPCDRPSAAELRAELFDLGGAARISIARRVGEAFRRARFGFAIACTLALMSVGTWFALSNAPAPVAIAAAVPPASEVVRRDHFETAAIPVVVEPRPATVLAPAIVVTAVRPSTRVKSAKRSVPNDEVGCDDVRAAMQGAREAHRWGDMLAAADARRCWTTEVRKQWRTKALMELGRFAACAAEGRDASTEQVRGWASLCERRAAKTRTE